MRFYELSIGTQFNPKSTFNVSLSAKNPCAPKIEFSVQSFDDLATAAPSFVKLYNAPLDWIKEGPKLIGQFLKLDAGLDVSPLTKNAGISKAISKTILNGRIDAVQTGIEAHEVVTAFYVSPLHKEFVSNASLVIAPGAQVASAIEKSLKQIYTANNVLCPKVSIDTTAKTVTNQNTEQYNATADAEKSVDSLRWICNQAAKFGLTLGFEAPKNNITIKVLRKALKGKDVSRVALPKISSLKVTEVSDSDFISQPQWESVTTATFNMHLNAKYAIGNTLKVPNRVVFSSGSLLGGSESVGLQGKNLSVLGGSFEIVQVTHIGNSRDENAEGWKTEVYGVAKNSIM